MILDLYILARFLRALLIVSVALFLVFFLVEVEAHASRFQVSGASALESIWLATLKSTNSLYDALPVVFSLAALLWSVQMALSSELVAVRAAGRSGVVVLMVPAVFAFAFGILGIFVLNPIVVAASVQYRQQVEQYEVSKTQVRVTEDKLIWLRHPAAGGQIVMRSRHLADSESFESASIFVFGADGNPRERYLAESAVLENQMWTLKNARKWTVDPSLPFQENTAEKLNTFKISTDLTPKKFRANFLSPHQMPLYSLLDAIEWMESSGLEPNEYRVYFHMEIAKLLLLPAMVLIGAGFTLRPSRAKSVSRMVALSIFSGLAVFFVRNFSRVFGENGEIGYLAAAWFPAVAALSLSLGFLLYLEDG